MNKREIILDFTSLLDVIMIILFFFILFSHIETEDAKLALQAAQEQAESVSAEAEQRLEEVTGRLAEIEEKERSAEEKLREASLSGVRLGQNVEGIMDFGSSTNIKAALITDKENNNWFLEISRSGDEKYFSRIEGTTAEEMSEKFSSVISELGYTNDDTILCEFVFYSEQWKSNSTYNTVNKMFSRLKNEYEHLFYSEIDLLSFSYDIKKE